MRVNANAVLRSWTLLAAFGGSYAPDMHDLVNYWRIMIKISASSNKCLCVCRFDRNDLKPADCQMIAEMLAHNETLGLIE